MYKREAEVERYLKERVDAAGGKCYKFVSPGNSGVPDRLILLPGGRMFFVELKAEGEKERKLQTYVQNEMRKRGATVYGTVDTKEKVDRILEVELCHISRAGEHQNTF